MDAESALGSVILKWCFHHPVILTKICYKAAETNARQTKKHAHPKPQKNLMNPLLFFQKIHDCTDIQFPRKNRRTPEASAMVAKSALLSAILKWCFRHPVILDKIGYKPADTIARSTKKQVHPDGTKKAM